MHSRYSYRRISRLSTGFVDKLNHISKKYTAERIKELIFTESEYKDCPNPPSDIHKIDPTHIGTISNSINSAKSNTKRTSKESSNYEEQEVISILLSLKHADTLQQDIEKIREDVARLREKLEPLSHEDRKLLSIKKQFFKNSNDSRRSR